MAYVGNPKDTQNTFQSLAGKRFNGDGSTTDFTLDVAPGSTLDIEVFVGNVRQDPNSAYTLSGTTLSFTGAPPSGTNNIYVVHQAKSVGTIDPPATETIAKTFSGNVTMSGTNTLSGTTTVSGALTASGGATISGTTPTLTVGDAGAEDAKIVFDGNAQDYHIGLDDSSDTLVVGLGSALGTTSYLTIDSAGHARFPNTSCFQAHLASDQSVSGSTNATVTMNTESFDINGDFNTSNYTFTAPVTGKYLLTTGVSNFAAAGGSTDYVQLKLNTSNASYADIHFENSGKIGAHQVAVVADMDASDTATVSIHSHDDSSYTVRGTRENTFFSGILIG